jgi:hypothetical protein
VLVKGYILLRAEGAPAIPRHLRGLTGPYLFFSEAEQASRVISAATGIACQISTIEVRRVLSELVRFARSFIIADLWNIRATETGYSAEAIIKGRLYEVVREGPEDVWHCADPEVIAPTQGETTRDTTSGG